MFANINKFFLKNRSSCSTAISRETRKGNSTYQAFFSLQKNCITQRINWREDTWSRACISRKLASTAWNTRAEYTSSDEVIPRCYVGRSELRELRNANNCDVFSAERPRPRELRAKCDRIARWTVDALSGAMPISTFQFCQGNRIRRCLRAVSTSRESFIWAKFWTREPQDGFFPRIAISVDNNTRKVVFPYCLLLFSYLFVNSKLNG